jgi:hypothetical protein
MLCRYCCFDAAEIAVYKQSHHHHHDTSISPKHQLHLPAEVCTAIASSIMLVYVSARALQSSVQLLKKGSFNRCRNSGLACITLTKSSDVQHCCEVMDGKQVYGRPMIVRKDKFEPDDPAYDSTTAAAAAAGIAQAHTPAAGSAVAAVQHVKGAAATAKQQVVAPAQCAAAAAATAAGGGPTNSSCCGTANSVHFVG